MFETELEVNESKMSNNDAFYAFLQKTDTGDSDSELDNDKEIQPVKYVPTEQQTI